MRRVLITGAGRGLGLEFANQCLKRSDLVFAGVRNQKISRTLQHLLTKYPKQLSIVDLDVSDPNSIDESYLTVRNQISGLDLLINNAGINSECKNGSGIKATKVLGHLDQDQLISMFKVNSIGPILIAQRYLDLLQVGNTPCIVSISSIRGSISNKNCGGNYGYSASKAALNMLMRTLAFDVLPLGIVAIVVDPGWVRTDMGGGKAPLTPSESVHRLLNLIDGSNENHTGLFFTSLGLEHPW